MRYSSNCGRLFRRLGGGAAAAVLVLTSLFAAVPASSVAAATPPHVMTIMMENTDYGQFDGSAAMPYLNELGRQYADLTEAYGWHYPSLPNYLELLSGSDEGVTNDCDITQPHCSGFTHQQLVQQLEAAGISWRAYYQGVPNGCYQGDGSGNYPYWHNSFRYFADFSQQCSHISGFGPLFSDLSSPDAPAFAWVVPDLVNSGGDNGTMSSGDTWLAGALPRIMATSWYRQGGQIVILYDTGYEDSGGIGGSSGGRIPMVVVSAHTEGMGAISAPVDTAGVLRSVEHAYGIPYLGNAANPDNGSLGRALVAGLPTGHAAPRSFVGALVRTPLSVRKVAGTLALDGVYRYPTGTTVSVGEDASGRGVVVTRGAGTVVVPGAADLESVSCTTASQCYAVGLAPSPGDDAVMVSIDNGQPVRTTALPTFIGLYGIACPSATTCYAVGYDNAGDADAVTTISNGRASAPAEVAGGGEWLNSISCPAASVCYAAGLVNYTPSIVPVSAGSPAKPLVIPNAWYVNGIDCLSPSRCVAVGQNAHEQGVVATMSGGKIATRVVPGSGYLYGVGCVPGGACVLTGAGQMAVNGEATGVLAQYRRGLAMRARALPRTDALGQVACGLRLSDCVAVGATTS